MNGKYDETYKEQQRIDRKQEERQAELKIKHKEKELLLEECRKLHDKDNKSAVIDNKKED